MFLTSKLYHGSRVLCIILSVVFSHTKIGLATPLHALKEANNCAGCHNAGRSQRPVLERRCTLDCQGCHVDPNGGGPRNQWGYYYQNDSLAMKNLITPIDPLKDESRFDLHYNGRIINYQAKEAGINRTFPMASELSLRIRPFIRYLHLIYQANFMGRVEDKKLNISDLFGNPRRFQEKYALMVDQLPLNTYVRAYRGTPLYGLKRSNHSAWIRERIGLDQYALTDAVEIGLTPNVPYFKFSQMSGDPNTQEQYKQKGTSFHAGLRGVTLGWHINTSLWNTKSESSEVKMQAIGLGANIFKTIIYAERNWRKVSPYGDTTSFAFDPSSQHPNSEIDDFEITYSGVKGLDLGLNWEKLLSEGRKSYRISQRISIYPLPFLQLELLARREYGELVLNDQVAIVHFFTDF